MYWLRRLGEAWGSAPKFISVRPLESNPKPLPSTYLGHSTGEYDASSCNCNHASQEVYNQCAQIR